MYSINYESYVLRSNNTLKRSATNKNLAPNTVDSISVSNGLSKNTTLDMHLIYASISYKHGHNRNKQTLIILPLQISQVSPLFLRNHHVHVLACDIRYTLHVTRLGHV